MEMNELLENWSTLDNARLVKKQLSIRLPVHVAAKIQALCEMYPTKTKTEIITDLLSASLTELYKSLPRQTGALINGTEWHEDIGTRREFAELANKHYGIMESELGNSSPHQLIDTPRIHAGEAYEVDNG